MLAPAAWGSCRSTPVSMGSSSSPVQSTLLSPSRSPRVLWSGGPTATALPHSTATPHMAGTGSGLLPFKLGDPSKSRLIYNCSWDSAFPRKALMKFLSLSYW